MRLRNEKRLRPSPCRNSNAKSRFFAAAPTLNVQDDEFSSVRQARGADIYGAGRLCFSAVPAHRARLAEVSMFRAPNTFFRNGC